MRYWDQDSNSGSKQDKEDPYEDNRSYQTANMHHSNKSGGKGSKAGSQRTRSALVPWDRPAKARKDFNGKVTWGSTHASFREYRKAIVGHLLTVDAGYLLDFRRPMKPRRPRRHTWSA